MGCGVLPPIWDWSIVADIGSRSSTRFGIVLAVLLSCGAGFAGLPTVALAGAGAGVAPDRGRVSHADVALLPGGVISTLITLPVTSNVSGVAPVASNVMVDGRPAEANLESIASLGADVEMVIDTSADATIGRAAQGAIVEFVRGLAPSVHVGLVGAPGESGRVPTDQRELVLTDLPRQPPGGASNRLATALGTGTIDPARPRFIVVFSRASAASSAQLVQAITTPAVPGAVIDVVQLTDVAGPSEALSDFARSSGGLDLSVSDPSLLPTAFDEIASALQRTYRLTLPATMGSTITATIEGGGDLLPVQFVAARTDELAPARPAGSAGESESATSAAPSAGVIAREPIRSRDTPGRLVPLLVLLSVALVIGLGLVLLGRRRRLATSRRRVHDSAATNCRQLQIGDESVALVQAAQGHLMGAVFGILGDTALTVPQELVLATEVRASMSLLRSDIDNPAFDAISGTGSEGLSDLPVDAVSLVVALLDDHRPEAVGVDHPRAEPTGAVDHQQIADALRYGLWSAETEVSLPERALHLLGVDDVSELGIMGEFSADIDPVSAAALISAELDDSSAAGSTARAIGRVLSATSLHGIVPIGVVPLSVVLADRSTAGNSSAVTPNRRSPDELASDAATILSALTEAVVRLHNGQAAVDRLIGTYIDELKISNASRAIELVELMGRSIVVTVEDAQRATGLSHQGVRNQIRRFEARGWLVAAEQNGRGGRRRWVAVGIIDAFEAAIHRCHGSEIDLRLNDRAALADATT